jgi:hypothetical protein
VFSQHFSRFRIFGFGAGRGGVVPLATAEHRLIPVATVPQSSRSRCPARGSGWVVRVLVRRGGVAVPRRNIEDRQLERDVVTPGRLALSKRETADALGVSVDFLEEHVMSDLRIVRCGRRRLIPVREIERWLDEHASRVLDDERRLG